MSTNTQPNETNAAPVVKKKALVKKAAKKKTVNRKAPAASVASKKASVRFPKSVIIPKMNRDIKKNAGRVDGSIVGFELRGYTFRWVSSTVQARNPGRIWRPLKISDLDPRFVEQWKEAYNHLCAEDGDLIRRNEMVLYVAANDAVKEYRAGIRELQKTQEGSLKSSKNRNKKKGLVMDYQEQEYKPHPEGI